MTNRPMELKNILRLQQETARSETWPGPLNDLYERPATIALLPPLTGLDVLDAGCGEGFYADHALQHGASVVAYDIDESMVERARQRLGDRCEVHHCALADLIDRLPGRTFDLIISALVLHHVEDLDGEVRQLAGLLKPGGFMVVSMKHPVAHIWLINKKGYSGTHMIERDTARGKLVHYQRPIGKVADAFHKSGLVIERFVEPEPTPELKEHNRYLYRATLFAPLFMHFVLRKPATR